MCIRDSNITNIANIDPRFLHESYDPDAAYSVPYTWGTMGILYNTQMVDEAPTSWQTLMDETYTMDMLMLNSPRDTLGIACLLYTSKMWFNRIRCDNLKVL